MIYACGKKGDVFMSAKGFVDVDKFLNDALTSIAKEVETKFKDNAEVYSIKVHGASEPAEPKVYF